MYKKYTMIFLVAFAAAAAADPVSLRDQYYIPKILDDQQRWESLGLSADVNSYVDSTISMVVPFIETHGLDPMGLLDVEEAFEVIRSRLRVRLTGNILTDWLVNPVIGVFVRIFDDIIMEVVQSNIRSAVQDAISLINHNLKDVISIVESFK